MCRLYGLHATHPTKIHCELLHVQNSFIRQAVQDANGYSNPHGWGIGVVEGGVVSFKRQVDPAHSSSKYRSAALRTYAQTVIAHLRRATVGEPSLENTHPFRWRDSFLAHNGHIDHFEEVKPRILDALPPERRQAIRGSTDSEHFLHLVLTAYLEDGAGSMQQALQQAVVRLRRWVNEASGEGEGGLGLNTLWVHQGKLAGTRLDRTLWVRSRDRAMECDVCGERHANPGGEPYRSVEFASERLTARGWEPIPDESVFWVDEDYEVHVEAMVNPKQGGGD